MAKDDLISLYEYKKKDISNALVVTGFPTIGIVGTIASRFVINALSLETIGAFFSDYFQPVTIISKGVPLPPVRIYAGDKKCGPDGRCEQIIVITSEFMPVPTIVRPLANKIIDWCEKKNCEFIVAIEGFNSGKEEDVPLYGIASTEKAKNFLKKYDVEIMQEGMVGGISGVLLYEGKQKGFNVICLLAGTHMEYPDAKAAAKILEVVNKMLPDIEIDPEPLYKEAEIIEQQLKKFMKESQPQKQVIPEAKIMYR
ncbi:ATP-grasp superfamily enzyme [Thermoplasmatales archaeon ex4484_30]|nr:MAG: ATP-grasp superfamily enzyme [Thermoplasmatales archaeon ex4484_30]